MFNRRLLKILALFLTVGGIVFLAGFQFGERKARQDFRHHLHHIVGRSSSIIRVDSLFSSSGELVRVERDTTGVQMTVEQLNLLERAAPQRP